jgi:Cof subfamily protein (haloacid dehalogenase superfamily)
MQKNLPFAGILLVSDLDGTLIMSNGEIPPCNIAAIDRFTQNGGLFALATGRSDIACEKYVAQIAVNAPSIIYNGTAIYDFQKKKFLWSRYLPIDAVRTIGEVIKRFPDVGAEVYSDGDIFIVKSNNLTDIHAAYEDLKVFKKSIDELPANCNKILFAAESSKLREVEEYTQSREHNGYEYVMSASVYYEVLPSGVTKGTTVRVLADMLKIGKNMIMGIGDYYNDKKLLETAAIAAVPADAPDELKALADIVVCRCDQGAVADFIEYIEKRYQRCDIILQ